MKKLLSVLLALVVLLTGVTAFGAENKFGIDVSHNNGSVNYVEEVKGGAEFVMIRLGNYNILDKEFWNNVQAVCEAGLDFGVYMYSAAFNVEEAKIEADFTIKTLSEMPEEYKEHFTLPVAYDMEASGLKDFPKKQLTEQVVTFSESIIKAGYVPMVYANTDWFTNKLDINKFAEKGYKIWLAHYVDKPDFTSKKQVGKSGVYADMWQYEAGDRKEGSLDKNVAYDVASLAHIYQLSSTVKSTCKEKGYKKYICRVCGKTKKTALKLASHKYDTGKVTQKPTSSAKGKMKYTCKVCGEVKAEDIAKISKASISKLTARSRGFTASWKKVSSSTGYQLEYSTSSKLSNSKKVTISKSSTLSKSIVGLKANKKYYVRIRTYRLINGKKYYSDWSSKKSVTTKK